MKLKMTLDELINTMEPQVRKDKALISKCIDGLTEYAAELRQKAGDPGKAQTPDLRRLVSELEGCWGLDTEVVDYVAAFDRKIQEAGIQQQRCEHQPAGSHDKRLDKLYPGRL